LASAHTSSWCVIFLLVLSSLDGQTAIGTIPFSVDNSARVSYFIPSIPPSAPSAPLHSIRSITLHPLHSPSSTPSTSSTPSSRNHGSYYSCINLASRLPTMLMCPKSRINSQRDFGLRLLRYPSSGSINCASSPPSCLDPASVR
jgi:hypothetical protein